MKVMHLHLPSLPSIYICFAYYLLFATCVSYGYSYSYMQLQRPTGGLMHKHMNSPNVLLFALSSTAVCGYC